MGCYVTYLLLLSNSPMPIFPHSHFHILFPYLFSQFHPISHFQASLVFPLQQPLHQRPHRTESGQCSAEKILVICSARPCVYQVPRSKKTLMGHMCYDSYIIWVSFGYIAYIVPPSQHAHSKHTHTHNKVKETNMTQYCSCAGQFTETLPFDSFIEQTLTFKNIARCVKVVCAIAP